MPAKNLKQSKGSKAERMFELFIKIYTARQKVDLEYFSSREWGSERRFRELYQQLNNMWFRLRGRYLFEIVGPHGKPASRGKRFFQLSDTGIKTVRAINVAVMPAFLRFLRVLKGTLLEDEFTGLYSKKKIALSKTEKKFLSLTDKKFFYLGKGMKDYRDQKDVIDEIYNAVLQEQVLTMKRRSSSGDIKNERVLPLTILMFNNGLYLVAFYEEQKMTERPRLFRVETIEDAECSRRDKFNYPKTYNPEKLFEGCFGLIATDKEYEVELEIKAGWAEEYLQSRSWTNNERYERKGRHLHLIMRVPDLREVSTWVLSFGDQLKVIKPKALKDTVSSNIQKMAKVYGI